jgi:hypothetical protein
VHLATQSYDFPQKRFLLQVLLRSHANKHALNANGDTPLSVAAFFGHDSVVAQLIEHQSSTLSPTTANATVFYHVHANEDGYTPLMLAAAGGHLAVAQRLLRVRHKNYRAFDHLEHLSDFGQTALALAADNGHVDMVQLLVSEGASLNVHGTIILWPMLFSDAIVNRIDPGLVYDIMLPNKKDTTLDADKSSSSFGGNFVFSPSLSLHNEMPNLTLSALVLMNQRILRASLGFALPVPFPHHHSMNMVTPELYLIHFLRRVYHQLFEFLRSTPFVCSARTKHLEDARAQRFEQVTGVALSQKQMLALLCMGGHGAFFFNTIVANHNEAWQRKARSK